MFVQIEREFSVNQTTGNCPLQNSLVFVFLQSQHFKTQQGAKTEKKKFTK